MPDISAAPDRVEAIPQVAGRIRHARRRPHTILTDAGYDSQASDSGYGPGGSRRSSRGAGRKRIIGLGRIRWVVEQVISHLNQFKRLAVRWERRLDLHQGFAALAAALVCRRRLARAV